MVSQLLSPSQPKNASDLFVIGVLAVQILLFLLLPNHLRIPVLGALFLCWRAAYNAGIGYLLQVQSTHRRLVNWAKKTGLFEDPAKGHNRYPWLYNFLQREMETKIPKDYKFAEAPVEYNTWLLFRRVVDLILMCDFVTYCLFAFACSNRPEGEGTIVAVCRWLGGIALFFFNLWVKLDAHRVVKDFAWYWGDFFFLIDQELTFDGVFEMAPHPMYSVGYAGYYGISMMAASYKVLFISIIAHAAQFAFLVLVESPHIEKTYSAPPQRRRVSDASEQAESNSYNTPGHVNGYPPLASTSSPSPVHNLIGLRNLDLHRVTDVAVILLQFQLAVFTIFTPSTQLSQALLVGYALVWRLWYGIGIGYILSGQSREKKWTRHFIKYGESTEEAWRQWKGVFHMSLIMTHASYIAAAWKMYNLPPDWEYQWALLRHTVGFALIALQIWTAVSVHESLGEFGWFYGDFFYEQARELNYSGIYRFLNNPDRDLGMAGVWGVALITWSRTIFFLALLGHLLTLGCVHFVEKPHMERLYGQSVRETSGVTKSITRSLPAPFRNWQGSVGKVMGDTTEFIEEFIESAKPKLAAGVETIMKDATTLIKQYPTRISITRVAPDLAGYDPKDYSIEVEGIRGSQPAFLDRNSAREGEDARQPASRRGQFQTLLFEYGAPIKVRWTAPLNHSKKDWIGLYMVADNNSREVTQLSSQGRWIPTNPGEYNSIRADAGILVSDRRVSGSARKDGESRDFLSGEMEFTGDKLWWTSGVFEFRYHHDGKHNVMAISQPFEIRIGRFDEDDAEVDANGKLRAAVEQALLPVVRNCFDRDPEIAPSTIDEGFGGLVERDGKYARRVVFAVHQM
jgi:phosphatidylethanolamine N-methyltransferase